MKEHYSKVITACCFLFLFVNVGMPSTSFNVYQPYLVQMVGDAQASLVLSVRTFATFASMFIVSWYYTRLNCRLAVFVGTLCTAAGFICYALATSLPMLFTGALLAGFGYSLGGNVGMTLLIGRWYKARVGTAIGIATVGSGVAGMVIPAIAVHIIEGVSLSSSFLAEGIFAVLVAVLAFALLRNYPSDIGVEPFGEQPDDGKKSNAASKGAVRTAAPVELTRTEHVLLFVAMVCVGIVCVGGTAYLSVLMTTNGFGAQFAAFMLSIAGAGLTVSKFLTGELFDRVGTFKGTIAVFAVSLAGIGLCLTVPLGLWPLAVAAAVLYGSGIATGSVGISVWALKLSNPSNRAKVVKDFQIGYALGGFVGDTFPGFLAESCGSYVPTYAIVFATTLFAAITIASVYRKRVGTS